MINLNKGGYSHFEVLLQYHQQDRRDSCKDLPLSELLIFNFGFTVNIKPCMAGWSEYY